MLRPTVQEDEYEFWECAECPDVRAPRIYGFEVLGEIIRVPAICFRHHNNFPCSWSRGSTSASLFRGLLFPCSITSNFYSSATVMAARLRLQAATALYPTLLSPSLFLLSLSFARARGKGEIPRHHPLSLSLLLFSESAHDDSKQDPSVLACH